MTLTYFISTNENGEVIGYGHGYGEAGMQPAINAYFTDYAEFITCLNGFDAALEYAEVAEEIIETHPITAEEIIADAQEEIMVAE